MGEIIVKGLKIFAYHGVNPEEKEAGQYFVLDLVCSVDISKACLTDNVDDTVSYAKIIKTAAKAFTSEKFDLIERAAYVTAESVLKEFNAVEEITVTLKKPDAPVKADIEYAAVKLTLGREEL